MRKLISILGLTMLFLACTHAQAADKGGDRIGSKIQDDYIGDTVKGFRPYVSVFGGVSAMYTDGHVGSFSDGGFDAAALAGGGLGFTSKIGQSPWFWGLEVNGERRMTSADSTPISLFFHGGALKYTVGLDGMVGANLSEHTRLYTKGGYRWGWSDDIASNFSKQSFNVPTKQGFEFGPGLSHDINKNVTFDLNVMAWFPDDATVNYSKTGKLDLNGTEISGRAGFRVSF